jgi:hypothetical protein
MIQYYIERSRDSAHEIAYEVSVNEVYRRHRQTPDDLIPGEARQLGVR